VFFLVLALFCACPQPGYCNEEPTVEELELRLVETEGAERLRLLIELATAYCFRSTEKALEYCEEALELAREVGDEDSEGVAIQTMAVAYAVSGEHDTAIEHSRRALEIFERLGDRIQIGKVLNNIGISYREMDQADQALE
jgi:tetratricopeptide (TPR) repeat protein